MPIATFNYIFLACHDVYKGIGITFGITASQWSDFSVTDDRPSCGYWIVVSMCWIVRPLEC